MLGIVITGHGSFASGLMQAMEQIVGKQLQCTAIDFTEGMTTEDLYEALNQASKICDEGDGLVFLTDLLGGTPFLSSRAVNIAPSTMASPNRNKYANGS